MCQHTAFGRSGRPAGILQKCQILLGIDLAQHRRSGNRGEERIHMDDAAAVYDTSALRSFFLSARIKLVLAETGENLESK